VLLKYLNKYKIAHIPVMDSDSGEAKNVKET